MNHYTQELWEKVNEHLLSINMWHFTRTAQSLFQELRESSVDDLDELEDTLVPNVEPSVQDSDDSSTEDDYYNSIRPSMLRIPEVRSTWFVPSLHEFYMFAVFTLLNNILSTV